MTINQHISELVSYSLSAEYYAMKDFLNVLSRGGVGPECESI